MTLRIIVEFLQLQLHVCVIVAVVRDQPIVEGKCLYPIGIWLSYNNDEAIYSPTESICTMRMGDA